ncbi:MAG: metal ABC transporter solute-binding protein, Zn/Mn family [Gemmataceae bacterium]
MRIKSGLLFLFVLTMVGCGTSENSGKPRVVVSILPQKWLVEQIVGDHVEVITLVKSGDSPATYQPSESQVSSVMGAKAYFRIGVPFENGGWFKSIEEAKQLTIVDCRKGITLRVMEGHHHDEEKEATNLETEDQDDSICACCQNGEDPHIWLTPKLLTIQAETMTKTLKEIDPPNADTFQKNFEDLKKRLEKLDAELHEKLEPMLGKPFFVFHPAWGYFAHEYGMAQFAIERAGKDPSDSELTELQEDAKWHGVKVIFVQPQITGSGADAVARAINGRTVELDPLSPEVEKNLRRVADEMLQIYQ